MKTTEICLQPMVRVEVKVTAPESPLPVIPSQTTALKELRDWMWQKKIIGVHHAHAGVDGLVEYHTELDAQRIKKWVRKHGGFKWVRRMT